MRQDGMNRFVSVGSTGAALPCDWPAQQAPHRVLSHLPLQDALQVEVVGAAGPDFGVICLHRRGTSEKSIGSMTGNEPVQQTSAAVQDARCRCTLSLRTAGVHF